MNVVLRMWACVALLAVSASPVAMTGHSVEVPLNEAGDVPVAEVVARLAVPSGVHVARPPAGLSLSTRGLSRAPTCALLAEALGPEVEIAFRPGALVLKVDDRLLDPAHRGEWAGRLRDLSQRAAEAARRRASYGSRARPSYRPNDPTHPTVCLVHGLNSTSGGFVHMIPWLEEAGYGVVTYDYPYNRSIAESVPAFAHDWSAFRKQSGDRLLCRSWHTRWEPCWPDRWSRTTRPGREMSPR